MISCSLTIHNTAYLALSKNNVVHLVPKWWQITFLLEYLILLLALITLIAPTKSKGTFTLK